MDAEIDRLGTTTLTPESRCPVCQNRLNAATSIGCDAAPAVGDVTVCCRCATPLEYADGFTVRQIDLSSLDEELLVALERAIGIVKSTWTEALC